MLAFRLGKETILLRTGWPQFDEEKSGADLPDGNLHIDLILHGLTQKESGLMKNLSLSDCGIAAIVAVIAGELVSKSAGRWADAIR